ncbi:winged helix-turn-helix domain-containing protein [Enterococcus rivorum]|uniref:OmpR/PhoB-type domain-containing protein n=1 Tax=Enterococcus rivorum TaxID=762845 RepID=A0A1E5KSP4_9ENTE|nr:winged helix-turn-helix domain-containing protein [Enterococcus rivorum]MBP2098184.1 two-component system response regulator VicR [Enterococcus rivorum]OEH80894.1 hypothetical protein BCR26_06590 [Enterococcus rivorum]
MYKIGVVSTSESNEYEHLIELKRLGHEINRINAEDLSEEVCDMEGCIIEDFDLSNLNRICEILMKVKKIFNGVVWVISKSPTKASNIVYLHLGADGVYDFQKDHEEFALQLNNALNRSIRQSSKINNNLLKLNRIELNPRNLSVLKNGEEISLTKMEFKLLGLLFDNKGQTICYEEISDYLWKEENGNIDEQRFKIGNLMFNLRKKVEGSSTNPRFLKTIRSKGYMFKI